MHLRFLVNDFVSVYSWLLRHSQVLNSGREVQEVQNRLRQRAGKITTDELLQAIFDFLPLPLPLPLGKGWGEGLQIAR